MCRLCGLSRVCARPSLGAASNDEAENGDALGSGLRRACSLSDLSKPSPSRRILPSPPNNGTHNSNTT